MRAVVSYESMFGNTHQIAVAIAEGLSGSCRVAIGELAATSGLLDPEVDLLVLGGPTHVHGASRASTRTAALRQAEDKHLTLDASAPGPGVREWVQNADFGYAHPWTAAFDTRADANVLLTGRAAPRIAKLLHRRGLPQLSEPMSFVVDRENHLLPGEIERAREWGTELARLLHQQVSAGTAGRG